MLFVSPTEAERERHGWPQSKPGWMKVSKGQSQPEIVAATFLNLHMVLGRPGFDCDSFV